MNGRTTALHCPWRHPPVFSLRRRFDFLLAKNDGLRALDVREQQETVSDLRPLYSAS